MAVVKSKKMEQTKTISSFLFDFAPSLSAGFLGGHISRWPLCFFFLR